MSSVSKNNFRHQRSTFQGRYMGAQPDYRIINSKHNKHIPRASKSQEKVNNPLNDKSTQGNINGPSCLVVKSKSEMRISSTREYCLMNPSEFKISDSHVSVVPVSGQRYIHNQTRKYHDYMNVVIPNGTGVVKEQMKMVVGDLENVLGELQTVVGDLQVLVRQIDIVTNKLDEEYKSESAPNISIKEDATRSPTALDILSNKRPSTPCKHSSSQSFDAIRKQMSNDYVFQAPARRTCKNLFKENANFKEFRPSSRFRHETKMQTKPDHRIDKSTSCLPKVSPCPVRIQMANIFYEQAKRAHEEKLKNNNTETEQSLRESDNTSYTTYDENRNKCLSSIPVNNFGFKNSSEEKYTNGILCSCQKSISRNKYNQQNIKHRTSEDSASIIIPSSVSNLQSDYCGVYERELDLKLELEFDDNLENYNGVDEGNTLELQNYTDYKLLQKEQPQSRLARPWKGCAPPGKMSVDLSAIKFSDNIQITTPTKISSDVLNDNAPSRTPETFEDKSLSVVKLDDIML